MIRLLITTPSSEFAHLLEEMIQGALCLVPLEVHRAWVDSRGALEERLVQDRDDVLLLDWDLYGDGTPDFVRRLRERHPRLRTVVLLPHHLRPYRQAVWEAGACNGVPKEHMDQEWLSSILCVMQRAMEREERLLRTLNIGGVHG